MYDNTLEFEDRVYLDPTTSRDEQMSFLDTYRDIQNKNNQQIAQENYNLGTPISSNLGGLGGGAREVWKGQYQRPQTNLAIANLTTAAQQSVLNQAMTNYQNMLLNRYNQAKRKAYNVSTGSNTVLPTTNSEEDPEDKTLPESGDGTELEVKDVSKLVEAFGPLAPQNLLSRASNWAKIIDVLDNAKSKESESKTPQIQAFPLISDIAKLLTTAQLTKGA